MNTRMAEARQAALDILKPSPTDLEHGLALHADALVVDAYGFSPAGPVIPETLNNAIAEGASPEELQNLVEAETMLSALYDVGSRTEYLEAWSVAGVDGIVQNAGEEGNSVARLLKRLARFTHVTDGLRPTVSRAAVPADIESAHAEGRHSLYMTGNGVPLAGRFASAEEELQFIAVFFQLGVRMMHLTYNRRNLMGDGCAEASDAGLSDFGRAVIAEMNRVGVIVDVAHSGWRTSLEAAQASGKPMVASHTACAALREHHRGKPDDVLRAIANTDGYAGICCIPAFLGGRGDISAFLDHLDHAIKLVGADHVAIGTDRAWRTQANLDTTGSVSLPKRRKSWENYWPQDDPLFSPDWDLPRQKQSLAWTNWPLFTVGLVQRGHSDKTIRKILGANVLRVAKANLAGTGLEAPLP